MRAHAVGHLIHGTRSHQQRDGEGGPHEAGHGQLDDEARRLHDSNFHLSREARK
jgi:hypothetical protein